MHCHFERNRPTLLLSDSFRGICRPVELRNLSSTFPLCLCSKKNSRVFYFGNEAASFTRAACNRCLRWCFVTISNPVHVILTGSLNYLPYLLITSQESLQHARRHTRSRHDLFWCRRSLLVWR